MLWIRSYNIILFLFIWKFSSTKCNTSFGDSSVNVYAYGYDATHGAQLVCSGTCNVYCYGGGCNNFTLGLFVYLFVLFSECSCFLMFLYCIWLF